VTRLSLGVQSFDPAVLAALGRTHTPDGARAAIDAALDAVGSVSVDLIFGTPGETPASWEASVEAALERGIHHLSTYALTVEPGTPLSRSVADGAPAPDGDDQADKWEIASDRAGAAGLARYETSNHARPGHHSRYNLSTWGRAEYHGMGVAAHRHVGGERSWNVRRLDGYLERVESGGDPTMGSERLDAGEGEIERVVLGVRRTAGVEPGGSGAALRASNWGRRLVDAGVITGEGRLVVLRPLLGDEVARALLALSG
jgi:oxygen-independent coproporphyrinogen-3 oxidase